jgi:mercuric ion transport protein
MKNSIIWISIVAIMLFACKAKTTESVVSESSTASDLIINPGALVQMDLSVEGMTCTGCENTINTGVSEIAGVIEVSSSFKDGKTFVKYDSTQTNIDKISQVINEKGYNVKGFAQRNTEETAVTPTQ